jgi:competence protein ComEA
MTKLVQSLLFCLMSALSFSALAQASQPATNSASKPAASKPAASKPAAASASASASAPAAKAELVDINSATEKELAELPKIGEARAKAIVKGRPYNGKDDLLNKKIIPKDAYAAIKDKVIAKQDKKADAKQDKKADAKADKKADAKSDAKASDSKTDTKKK